MTDYPYPYPVSNTDLKRHHKLEPHPEGGYFRQTVALGSLPGASAALPPPAQDLKSSSSALTGHRLVATGPGCLLPTADDDTESSSEIAATQIYYLLDPSSPIGWMHVNLHAHFLLHHAGRSLYTFLRPANTPDQPPDIHRVVMGPDPARGEVTQLLVPGGWYKTAEIPEEDLLLLDSSSGDELQERIGAFITEVVVPGWAPEQCKIMDRESLRQLWGDHPGWETYMRYVKPEMNTTPAFADSTME